MAARPSQRNHLAAFPESSIRHLCQFLEDSELYDFCLTCLQMHKPALVTLLSRRNIPNPSDTVEIHLPDTEDTLRALRIALFLPTIRQLSVRFSPGILPWMVAPFPPLTIYQLQETTDVLLKEMRHLLRLLTKLKSVEEITLILPGSLEWNLRDMNLERGPSILSVVFPWPDVVSFFQHAVDKHCTSLKVESSRFRSQTSIRPARATRISPSLLLRRILKRDSREMDMTALARWDGVKYRPEPHTTHSESSIRHLHLCTTLLLFPSAAGWTFSILQNSPIVSLQISGLSVSRWDWDVIASKLNDAVPSLRELHLDDREIQPDCLVRMLERFSGLTTLHLGPRMSVYLAYPHLFPPVSRWYVPAFLNLVKLSAPSCYVSLFLMRRNPLPALNVLEMPPIDIHHRARHYHESTYINLPKIIRRLRDLGHVLYPLPVTFSVGGWSDTSGTLSKYIDRSLGLDPEFADSLREITHLVLGEGFDASTIDPKLFCRWLRLFPSLQQISWGSAGPERVATASVFPLAREISRACPTVETIVARGVRHSISATLSSIETAEGSNAVVSRFVELPTEVLLLVFDFLRDELFSLSILCRRLHYLALPNFLEKHSIPDPSDTTRLHLGWMANSSAVVHALIIALFIPSIRNLICVFPDHTYAHLLAENMKRFTRLIQRLTAVQTLSLEFSLDFYHAANSTIGYSEERLWQTTYPALRDLLDAVSNKSCTSLKIIGCPVPDFFSGIPPFPPPSISSVTTLSLDIGRGATPCSRWIYTALKASPVTSLKLTVTASDGPDAGDFPLTLTALSMEGKHASRSNVLKYLARHPLLKTVTLALDLAMYNHPSDLPTPRLANLVVLTAPISYISHFFKIRDPFPALERLTMLLDCHNDMRWGFASLIERVRESYAQHPPAITVEIPEVLPVYSLPQTIGFLSSMGGKWTHAARSIVEVTVTCGFSWFAETGPGSVAVLNPGFAQLLLSWFTLFKGLRGITLAIGGYESQELDETRTAAALVELAELIGSALASVETIRFDQQTLLMR